MKTAKFRPQYYNELEHLLLSCVCVHGMNVTLRPSLACVRAVAPNTAVIWHGSFASSHCLPLCPLPSPFSLQVQWPVVDIS